MNAFLLYEGGGATLNPVFTAKGISKNPVIGVQMNQKLGFKWLEVNQFRKKKQDSKMNIGD